MKCPKCNATDHEPSAKFCHRCGAPLQKQAAIYNGLAFKEVLQKRDSTDNIIIYHTEVTSPHTIKEIHQWHLDRKKNPLAGVAYHYFIDINGMVALGRPYDTKGAFNKGYNSNSIAVCFDGDLTKQRLTDEQVSGDAINLLMILTWVYEEANILFFDELNGYKGNPMLEYNKDKIREELSGSLEWLEYKLKNVYHTSEEEDFFNTLDWLCRQFGLPFKIR